MAELEKTYARQYGTNVYVMAQQRGSRLRPFVNFQEMKGEKRHFDRVHPTAAVKSDSKFGDTPLIHTYFDRRTVHGTEYTWADMVDWQDDLDVFIDPTSSIVKMGSMAMGRIIDDIIIENAFDGPSYEGKEGLQIVPFPDSQKIAITTGQVSDENTGLNIEKLIQIQSRFGDADIDLDDPENKIYMAVTQKQIDDLVRGTDIKSRDYDAIKALGERKSNSFYGIEFIRTGRLKKTAVTGGYSRLCCAWCKSGIILCLPKEISMNVETRADKNDNWQALAKMKGGATRYEDAKVLQVFCFEASAS